MDWIKNLFGIKIAKKDDQLDSLPSFAQPENEDGAINVINSSGFFGQYIDLDGTTKNKNELITRYREMALHAEISSAIEEIVNEAICEDENGKIVEINLDDLKVSPNIKQAIEQEFSNILKLLKFSNYGQDIFKKFYIDGRLFYHVITDNENLGLGIQELRYIDPRNIEKVKEVKKEKDAKTGIEIFTELREYYIYNNLTNNPKYISNPSSTLTGVKISPDSIININSGILDSRKSMTIGWLHPAIKPLNLLRTIEDAIIIHKIGRAPSRRIFKIDVGNLPKQKAEQYVRDLMTKYKNKVVYDAATGSIRDNRNVMSLLEDYWLPVRGDQSQTKIETLANDDNGFADMTMVDYFKKSLYQSLNVPINRLDPNDNFSLGKTNEITREEVNFSKFINKLRMKFSPLFDEILRIQLVLKGICTAEEWDEFKEYVIYDFKKDNNFEELKESEILRDRLGLLLTIDPYAGKDQNSYFSKLWVQKNILKMTDEEIEEENEQIQNEIMQNIQMQAQIYKTQLKLGLIPPEEQGTQ